MSNKYMIIPPEKILSTHESNEVVNQLRAINTKLHDIHNQKLRSYEQCIYNNEYHGMTNIYTHIKSILYAFKKKHLTLNSEDYYYIMYCGDIILSALVDKSSTPDSKCIMALFFLNYLIRFTTHEYRNTYPCNIIEYIHTCYKNNNSERDVSAMTMVYSNLKKIVYVKKYPYMFDGKIFSILLNHWASNNYTVCEIPASYINAECILYAHELSEFDVSKRDIDILFGTYLSIAKDDRNNTTAVINDSEHDQDPASTPTTNDIDDLDTVGIENEDVSTDEAEEYVYESE